MSVEVYDRDYDIAEHKPTMAELFSGESSDMFTTMKIAKLEDRIKVAKTLGESKVLDDEVPVEFLLEDIFVYPSQVLNAETGDLDDIIMINLITDNGVYRTGSSGVRNSIVRFTSILGPIEEWIGKVKFRASTERTRAGRKVIVLNIVD